MGFGTLRKKPMAVSQVVEKMGKMEEGAATVGLILLSDNLVESCGTAAAAAAAVELLQLFANLRTKRVHGS